MGGSAGGLLMGAVMNQAPDLFNGVVAAVPFVDVVSTMLDETIPLTTFEWDEWGNPNRQRLLPLHEVVQSVRPGSCSGLPQHARDHGYWDSQVQYWEPAKWVAKLRELKTDDNVLLFHTNMDAGHGGQSGSFPPVQGGGVGVCLHARPRGHRRLMVVECVQDVSCFVFCFVGTPMVCIP